jgi:hypothetical protein
MKHLIEEAVTKLVLIKKSIETTTINVSADQSLSVLSEFITEKGFDSGLGIRLAALLQLSNDEAAIQTYELKDIVRLYEALLETFPDNLDHYIEAAYFFDAVIGDREKATELAHQAKNILNEKQIEVKKLLEAIEE